MTLERALLYNHENTPWYRRSSGMFGEGGVEILRREWIEQRIVQAGGVPVFRVDQGIRREPPSLIDASGKKTESLAGYDVLLRSHQFEDAWDVVESFGGNSFWTRQDSETVYRWPEHVKPAYLRRKIAVIPAWEVIAPSGFVIWDTLSGFQKDGKVFVKSMKKIPDRSFGVATMGDEYEISHLKRFVADKTIEYLIVSEPVSIIRDPILGKQEYRCVVAGGDVVSASFQHHTYHVDLPNGLVEAAQGFAQDHRGILPWGYVLDLGIASDGRLFIVELNSITHAGMYRTNYFESFLKTFAPSFDEERFKREYPAILKELERLDNERFSSHDGPSHIHLG